MTNFEYIKNNVKNMSTDKMASFINNYVLGECRCCVYLRDPCAYGEDKDCEYGIKKWLEQEAEAMQDPWLPLGVTNAMAENEPPVITRCDTCGENICKGDWIYKIDGKITCDNTSCAFKQINVREYALDFCITDYNINDFIEHINFIYYLESFPDSRISDILVDSYGDSLVIDFCEMHKKEFIEWLANANIIESEKLKR